MRSGRYDALKKKILGVMILVPIVPFLLVLLTGYHFFTKSLRNNTISHLEQIIDDHSRLVDLFLAERTQDLESIAETHGFEELRRPEALAQVFVRLRARAPAFVDLGVFDANGMHLAYQGPYDLAGRDYGEATWFRKVREQGRFVSDVFLGFRNVPHFVIAIARESDGQAWVLRGTIDTLLFTDIVEKVRVGKSGEAYILNTDGAFQTERRSGGNLLESDGEAAAYLVPHQGIRTFRHEDTGGEKYVCATSWMNEGNWLLVVRQEEADAFRALDDAIRLTLLISTLGLGAIVALALYLTHHIVRRMERVDEEKGRLSQQLIVAGRLAEIGEMAAGLAHEINNPLQIIRVEQTLIETLLEEMREDGGLPDSDRVKEVMDSVRQIELQTKRCGKITQSLLNFARRKEPVTEVVDLARFVPEILEMVANKASVDGIELVLDCAPAVPRVLADSGQLQQVLLNLLNNAFDAVTEMHGGQGGRVEVALRGKGEEAVLRVSDNGTGIAQENIEKVFTPFFTTKPVGRGTGLGLSVCYAIVKSMGGSIHVESEWKRGTSFTIKLPAAEPGAGRKTGGQAAAQAREAKA